MGSSKNNNVKESSLADLLPNAFTPAALNAHEEEGRAEDEDGQDERDEKEKSDE